MAIERIPMTREGYDKLKAELDNMQGVQMIEVTKRVATAREMGDLSENAEYHAAREDQGILQAKINELKGRLSLATIVDRSAMPTDTVAAAQVAANTASYRSPRQAACAAAAMVAMSATGVSHGSQAGRSRGISSVRSCQPGRNGPISM